MPDKQYTIAERLFTQQELVLGQIQFIKQRLSQYDVTSLTKAQVVELVIDEGPALLAIVLIPQGQTRADKVKAGWAAIKELEAWLQAPATTAEVAAIASDFFQVEHAILDTLWGRAGRRVHAEISRAGLQTPS